MKGTIKNARRPPGEYGRTERGSVNPNSLKVMISHLSPFGNETPKETSHVEHNIQ